MLSFTLDTNCIIDIDENRLTASAVRILADAHAAGKADVSLVAVSSSECQPDKTYLADYSIFQDRVRALGLDHLNVIFGLACFDISFFDVSLWASESDSKLEQLIHTAMFPTIPFNWTDFAAEHNLRSDNISQAGSRKWRNAWCDRQMFWAHQNAGRDIFVTSNMSDFGRINSIPEFSNARIMKPDEAAALVNS